MIISPKINISFVCILGATGFSFPTRFIVEIHFLEFFLTSSLTVTALASLTVTALASLTVTRQETHIMDCGRNWF